MAVSQKFTLLNAYQKYSSTSHAWIGRVQNGVLYISYRKNSYDYHSRAMQATYRQDLFAVVL